MAAVCTSICFDMIFGIYDKAVQPVISGKSQVEVVQS